MPKITFITKSGDEMLVDGDVGETVMEVGVKHGVPGIDADCGGACSCATCHIFIPEEFRELTGSANSEERGMLEFTDEVQEGSRLACQISVTDAFDGLKVNVANA